MTANLYSLFASSFPADRDACAIEAWREGAAAPGLYTWNDIDHATAKIANLFANIGLPKGARVAAQVDKSPEALFVYLATLRAGLVYVPLNPAYREAEMAHFIADAEPGVVVCGRQNFSWVSRLAFVAGRGESCRHVFTLDDRSEGAVGTLIERAAFCADAFATVSSEPDDLAAILYTSGTTGRSKGAVLSHGNLAANALTLRDYWQWRRADVLLHTLPIFHVHGLFVAAGGALLSGSKMIWLPKFDVAQTLAHLSRATVFMGVPTFYTRLLAEPHFDRAACRNVRLFVSGSAPLSNSTFDAFAARTGQPIVERYGMSETNMLASNPVDGERIGGTVGPPLPGVAIRIVNDADKPREAGVIGHVQVRGPNVFSGYWRLPEKTAAEFTADGWFRTGDMGKLGVANLRGAGYLTIAGRSKDLIITGGLNVYPKEDEAALEAIAGVAEAAVIGVPHADFGEAVVAVVVRTKTHGDGECNAGAIIELLKPRIANFKVPKRIVFVDELPRNAMGKVQKNLLRERFDHVEEDRPPDQAGTI